MKTRYIVIIICVMLVVGTWGLKFIIDNKTYSANDLFENAAFSTANRSIEVTKIQYNPLNLETITIPEEKQKMLIDSFKNTSFKKTDESYEVHYRIQFSLNSDYAIFIDVDKGIIVNLSNKYSDKVIVDEGNFMKDFIEILEIEG